MTAIRNAMTVDVEDYYQVSAMESVVARDDWDSFPSHVVANTEAVLKLFAKAGVKGTFFTLGWVAERHPDLIRRIVAEGHELASHGYRHVRVSDQSESDFREDIRRTKALLEDIGGVAVKGYRAASFSLTPRTPWAHAAMAEVGYSYSSSVYPGHHDHYGIKDAPRRAYRPLPGSDFLEIPITTVELFGKRVHAGGGGYFRLFPFALYRRLIERVNSTDDMPAIFYFHPWEIDPDQPRVAGIDAKARFRHYLNLRRMRPRLEALLAGFAWGRMDEVFPLSGPVSP
ncbi:MAG: DUF3473 domain-containing protein [Rhodothalassiaceae bacterium]